MENLHASHEKMALPVLSALADEQLDLLQDKQHMIEFMMFFGPYEAFPGWCAPESTPPQYRRN